MKKERGVSASYKCNTGSRQLRSVSDAEKYGLHQLQVLLYSYSIFPFLASEKFSVASLKSRA